MDRIITGGINMANSIVNFAFGTKSAYDSLTAKDSDTLYFIDGKIFKGDTQYSGKISFVSALPDSPVMGMIYVLPDYSASFYNGTDYNTISVGTVSTIGETEDNDSKIVTQGAVKTYVSNKLKDLGVSDDVSQDIATAKSEAIESAKSYTDTTKEELENTINTKIASVFRFKGTKASLDEVQALTDMITGDVWHISEDGKEYVYTGSEWELLGFTVDLSSYTTNDDVTQAINTAMEDTVSSLDSHIKDTAMHITSAERTAWNAKASSDDVSTAKSEAISSSKSYADELNTAMDTRVKAVEAAVTWNTL